MSVNLGSYVPITETVYSGGVAVVPATATLYVTLPDLTTATPIVLTPAIPLAYDYLPPSGGPYRWRIATTGPVATIDGSFYVKPQLSMAFLSAQELREFVQAAITDEPKLQEIAEATAGAIEGYTGKIIAPRSVTETIPARAYEVWLRSRPVISLTSIASPDASVSWTVGNLDVDLPSGRVTILTGPAFRSWVRVTYATGMTIIPPNWILAAKIMAKAQWEIHRGTTNLSTRPGGLEDAVPMPGLDHPVPKRALELLGPRPPMVA